MLVVFISYLGLSLAVIQYSSMEATLDPRKVSYLSPPLRLLAAFLSAYYIIIEGQPGPFYKTVQSLDFLITLVFSFVIALALIELVHLISRQLDRIRPWKTHAYQRLLLQVVLGVVLVIWIDLLLVKGFFKLFNYDFEKSRYLVSEFPLVKWMIYILNIYYWTCHVAPGLFNVRRLFSRKKLSFRPVDPDGEEEPAIDLTAGAAIMVKLGAKAKYVGTQEVGCFKRESAIGYAYLRDGTIWNFDYTANELLALLPEGLFFQTSRGIIYSLDIIEGHRRENKEGLLILKEGFELNVSRTVSRDRYAQFRRAYNNFLAAGPLEPAD